MTEDLDLDKKEDKEEEKEEELDPKIQDQIDKGVDAGIAKAKEDLKPEPEPEPEEKPDLESFVDSGWQPKTWNDVFRKNKEISRNAAKEVYDQSAKEKEDELKKINKEFDDQFEELRKGGEKIDKATEKEVFKLGIKLGSSNIKELYGVHKGMKAVKKEEAAEKTLNLAERASKVGSRGSAEKGKGQKSYADIAGKSMDDLVSDEFDD